MKRNRRKHLIIVNCFCYHYTLDTIQNELIHPAFSTKYVWSLQVKAAALSAPAAIAIADTSCQGEMHSMKTGMSVLVSFNDEFTAVVNHVTEAVILYVNPDT